MSDPKNERQQGEPKEQGQQTTQGTASKFDANTEAEIQRKIREQEVADEVKRRIAEKQKASIDKVQVGGTPTKYFRIRLQIASDANQEQVCTLSVQGRTSIQIKRGAEAIVDETQLDALNHMKISKWETRDGQPYRTGEQVDRFPYTLIGPATDAEYWHFLREGNKTRDAEFKKLQEVAEMKHQIGV